MRTGQRAYKGEVNLKFAVAVCLLQLAKVRSKHLMVRYVAILTMGPVVRVCVFASERAVDSRDYLHAFSVFLTT